MIPISVIVITKNEERNIDDCLKSVTWANEIIVVDSDSSDSTVEKARQYTTQVLNHEWKGFGEAKNFALSQCKNEWALWIDADERVTPELQREIMTSLDSIDSSVVAFRMPRLANFLGRWIYHCGWYPGYVVRLFKKSVAQFSDDNVHEQLVLSHGTIGSLRSPLLHYTDPDLNHYFEKFNRYTSLAAADLANKGAKFHHCSLVVHPLWTFIRMYILKLGFLDGREGFILSVLSAHYVFVKYAKFWEQLKKGE
ncbi:MAG TPA: glycosyltransferase family 2 protein [Bacteroidota bacterium]|nr:glycosyltransferase family 2 protein [Bacteroidota bacterium]